MQDNKKRMREKGTLREKVKAGDSPPPFVSLSCVSLSHSHTEKEGEAVTVTQNSEYVC